MDKITVTPVGVMISVCGYRSMMIAKRFELVEAAGPGSIVNVTKDQLYDLHEMDSAGYPDGNPKTRIGAAKPGIKAIPPVAIYKMGQAMADGERKYGLFNWREHQVSSSVYYEAAMRHLMSWWDGEDVAADSGVDHLAHAMACMAIMVDAKDRGKLNDDRTPHKGGLPEFVKANTKTAA